MDDFALWQREIDEARAEEARERAATYTAMNAHLLGLGLPKWTPGTRPQWAPSPYDQPGR